MDTPTPEMGIRRKSFARNPIAAFFRRLKRPPPPQSTHINSGTPACQRSDWLATMREPHHPGKCVAATG